MTLYGIFEPQLDWWNVTGASIFVWITVYISHSIGLKLEVPLFISSLRCVLQLTLVGFVLDDILRLKTMWPVMLITVCLVLIGAYETLYHRSKKALSGMFPAVFLILLASNGIVGSLGIYFALGESLPFWTPSIFVPVMGMLLGNAMGSIAVATTASIEAVVLQQNIIETRLSLGASRSEAVHHVALGVIHTAMLPALAQLSVMGMINIPGMMTGQILAGVPIRDAVTNQICIMFMSTASNGFGVLLVTWRCMRTLVDKHHMIRTDRILTNKMNLFQVYRRIMCCCRNRK